MSLLTRINLWLCTAFLCFLLTAVFLSRAAMREDARSDAIEVARLLMDSAQAARDYTANKIEPAAQTMFRRVPPAARSLIHRAP